MKAMAQTLQKMIPENQEIDAPFPFALPAKYTEALQRWSDTFLPASMLLEAASEKITLPAETLIQAFVHPSYIVQQFSQNNQLSELQQNTELQQLINKHSNTVRNT